MWKRSLVSALRALRRRPGTSAISVASLTAGVTACLLILLYVQHERSFDRHLPDADRVYRVVTEERGAGGTERTAMTTADLTPVLWAARPDLAVARLYRWPYSDVLVQRGERRFNEGRFFRVDSTFFDVFGLEWVRGDPSTALDRPYSVVLTERTAARYFGDRDPVGEPLRVGSQTDYVVSGVVRDAPPNTHVSFDFLAFNGRGFPDGWDEKKVWTYAKLPPQADAEAVGRLLPGLVGRHFPEHLHGVTALSLQPLTDIHLDAGLGGEIQPGGNRTTLAALMAVALGFLLIACVNYVNLATAQGTARTREIGVRKAIGSSRGQLAAQFLSESVLVAFVAVALSGVLVVALRPVVNAAFGVGIPPVDGAGGALVAALTALVLVVGLLAGAYPAFYLASLSPVRALKGGGGERGPVRLREGLVVFQFAATLVLLVGTLVVGRQVRYMLDDSSGIGRADVLMVTVPRDVAVGWDWNPGVLRDALLRQPRVQAVSAVHVPWGPDLEQYRLRVPGAPETVAANVLWVTDDAYADLYGLTLREGRTRLLPSNPDAPGVPVEVVVNETAVRQLGLATPVGHDVELALDDVEWQRGRVVGVVEDAPYRTLHHEVQPLLFLRGIGFSSVAVRVEGGDPAAAVADVAAVWERLAPDWPFEYTVLEDDYRQQYQAEERAAGLARAFTGLSLLIACLGLLGLTAFLAEQRRKEVAVRKVLGATVARLVVLLSRDVARLVLVALVVAAPVAYLLAGRWLEQFAYRSGLGPVPLVAAGALVMAVALLTVSVHALRAATADPVRALRSE